MAKSGHAYDEGGGEAVDGLVNSALKAKGLLLCVVTESPREGRDSLVATDGLTASTRRTIREVHLADADARTRLPRICTATSTVPVCTCWSAVVEDDVSGIRIA